MLKQASTHKKLDKICIYLVNTAQYIVEMSFNRCTVKKIADEI